MQLSQFLPSQYLSTPLSSLAMELKASELCAFVSSIIGLLTVAQTLLHGLVPPPLRRLIQLIFSRLSDSLSRFSYIEIHEYDDDSTNDFYRDVKLHLGAASCRNAKRIKLSRSSHSNDFTYTHAGDQSIPISFQGANVFWKHHISQQSPQQHGVGYWPSWRMMSNGEKRKYVLQIQKNDKAQILNSYMDHILKEAKEIRRLTRERRLYTNGRSEHWESVVFRHPSTFDTLALDPRRKDEIMADLRSFAQAEHFYKRTGRAWKRGYLLYGPPGTGKSSMIAAIANFLRYDVYDLELTQVRSNGELRKLLWRTTDKSLIVIEDIDCSLNLTNRGKKHRVDHKSTRKSSDRNEEEQQNESITLSGLLNFTDGLWSCCGDERIFIFTTNHVEKLDPALLRSGRMDMHILMSYCTFNAFKILAFNYLGVEDHYLFPKVEKVIEEAHVTPAEVSEILVRKRDDPETALNELLTELEVNKAKPWPPQPPSAPSEELPKLEATVEEVQEEVKKALVSESISEKQVCPTCLHCKCAHEQEKSAESVEVELTTQKKPKIKRRLASDKDE